MMNYAGIIFGREIGFDKTRSEIIIRPELYFDRNGKIVLVEHSDIIDDDSGSYYTVKEYESIKSEDGDGWAHQRILLKPRSSDPSFETLVLNDDDTSRYRVVGEFLRVLD